MGKLHRDDAGVLLGGLRPTWGFRGLGWGRPLHRHAGAIGI